MHFLANKYIDRTVHFAHIVLSAYMSHGGVLEQISAACAGYNARTL
jgi:hypothetical protein